jgi:hypothetical protein
MRARDNPCSPRPRPPRTGAHRRKARRANLARQTRRTRCLRTKRFARSGLTRTRRTPKPPTSRTAGGLGTTSNPRTARCSSCYSTDGGGGQPRNRIVRWRVREGSAPPWAAAPQDLPRPIASKSVSFHRTCQWTRRARCAKQQDTRARRCATCRAAGALMMISKSPRNPEARIVRLHRADSACAFAPAP